MKISKTAESIIKDCLKKSFDLYIDNEPLLSEMNQWELDLFFPNSQAGKLKLRLYDDSFNVLVENEINLEESILSNSNEWSNSQIKNWIKKLQSIEKKLIDKISNK